MPELLGMWHPTFEAAPAERRWWLSPESLWGALSAGLDPDSSTDRWTWYVRPSGTVVALRMNEGVRELRIQEPPLPRAERLQYILHARWAREVDDLRTAFGVRGWDRLETADSAVVWVDRARVAPPTVAAPPRVPTSPAPRAFAQGELLLEVVRA